jgi:hypothetical protein
MTIVAPGADCESLVSISMHRTRTWIAAVFDYGLVILDFEKQSIVASRSVRRRLQGGGFYPDLSKVWTLPEADSGSVDWGVWEIESGTYCEYELERCDHYGRGAVLHPGGELIGACWSAYECGYFAHLIGTEGRMGFFAQPAAERPEYEAYSPAFSADGKYFAMICNPYTNSAAKGTLCVFEFETAKLLWELPQVCAIVDPAPAFLAGGAQIAFCAGDTLRVHDSAAGRLVRRIDLGGSAVALAGHPLLGMSAVADARGVRVFLDERSPAADSKLCQLQAIECSMRFVTAHSRTLV